MVVPLNVWLIRENLITVKLMIGEPPIYLWLMFLLWLTPSPVSMLVWGGSNHLEYHRVLRDECINPSCEKPDAMGFDPARPRRHRGSVRCSRLDGRLSSGPRQQAPGRSSSSPGGGQKSRHLKNWFEATTMGKVTFVYVVIYIYVYLFIYLYIIYIYIVVYINDVKIIVITS